LKVAVSNVHGEGPATAPVSQTTANVPETPAAPTIEEVGTTVKISWTEPSDRLKPITAYQVTWLDSSGGYVEHTSICDGSQEATKTARECVVEMAVLKSTLGLSASSGIQARISATNSEGTSADSDSNEVVAQIREAPTDNPTGVSRSSRSNTSFLLSWTALPTGDTGNSPVTEYAIYRDGTEVGTSTTTTYTDTGLTALTTYAWKVTARNIYGESDLASAVPLTDSTTDVPAQMAAPVLTQASGSTLVKVDFAAPSDNGEAIIDYEITFTD